MKAQKLKFTQYEYSQLSKIYAECKPVKGKNFNTRELLPDDAECLYDLEKEMWKEEAASIPLLQKRIRNTRGYCWAAFDKYNYAKASMFWMGISKSKIDQSKNWYETTDLGTAQFHDPNSKYVFGISLAGNDSEAVDDLLTRASIKVLIEGIKEVYLGSPLSSLEEYKKSNPDLDIHEYVFNKTKIDGKKRYRDSHINYYAKLGFKPVYVKDNYFPYPGSEGYGAVIRLKNPFVSLAPLFRLMGEDRLLKHFKIIRKLGDWVM